MNRFPIWEEKDELLAAKFSEVRGAAMSASSARASSTPGAPPRDPCGSVYGQPPNQSGKNLDLIVIASDTFRSENLACYGPSGSRIAKRNL
jgi:hypothetical protein